MKKFISVFAITILLSGCASRSSKVSPQVSKQIETRVGHGLNPNPPSSGFSLPPGISLTNGITEDDAVAIALWNNAAFQVDLTALGFARADLIEAGQLRNPIFTLLFPLGPKQLEATANLPLEIFWQRPRRVAAAKAEMERVGESLVQTGLNLVRDVKVAHTDLALAYERARIAAESVQQRNEIAQIVKARFRAGDISEMETAASQIDAKQATELATRLQSEVAIAQERLRFLLGMNTSDTAVDIVAISPISTVRATTYQKVTEVGAPVSSTQSGNEEVTSLVKQAFATRPDLRAAELAVEAAAKRAKWERSKIFSLSAILDANGAGKEGFESGPGVQVELPVFNHNKGGITRAEAEIERLARQYIAVRQRITLEVREAYVQLQQSRKALASWRGDILPVIEEEIRNAEKAYANGNTAYLFVLETSRKLYDARLQEAESSAAIQRATAQLERAVGRNLIDTP
jgi:cobalt-zinc-cadmium efflux system outer membrane protein